MTFTPGPWTANRLIVSSGGAVPVPLALMALHGSREAEAEANARLIAAAPDLLEAAKFVLDNSMLYRIAGWEKLQAAINKAEAKS
jgi:hypothetical protein